MLLLITDSLIRLNTGTLSVPKIRLVKVIGYDGRQSDHLVKYHILHVRGADPREASEEPGPPFYV